MNLLDYREDEILQDGSSVQIRALRRDDTARLLELSGRLSRRSVPFKFFRTKQWPNEGELAQLTDLDFKDSVALAATLREEGIERIIGIGWYSTIREGSRPHRRADIAFAVADQQQRRGIGTLLLEHLVPVARSAGITEFEADVLGENDLMLQVLADSGFKVKRSFEAGVIHVSLSTTETEESAEARLHRERHAAAESVRAFISPRSVAIIGASRQPGTIGAALVSIVKHCGFAGPVYPVNPKAGEIDGLKAYPNVSAIGKPVDLALISVPAPLVEQAVRECTNAGTRGAVIISSGFGEVSQEGRRIERMLRQLARSSGMRLVGPNCMGLLNTNPGISLNATFVPTWPPAGNIGMLSQSGALGYVILDQFQNLNIGLSSFVSVGNQADVSVNDLLAYWSEDSATRVIMLYLESFGNPRGFARIARDIARSKPIVALKAGRSAAGTRAASSHSAALASFDTAVEALFEQSSVIRTETIEELMDVTMLLSSQPIPSGSRVGLITNAGGPGIMLADACEIHGLSVPEFAPATIEQLKEFLPSQAGFANPIDMIASASAGQYAAAIRIAGADPNVDSLIVIYIPPQLHPPEEVAHSIAAATGDVPAHKPVLLVFMSTRGAPLLLCSGPRGRLPSYRFPENAAKALSAAERYGRRRKRPSGSVLSLDSSARIAVRAIIDRVLSDNHGPVWLEPADVFLILRAAGIEAAACEIAGLLDAPDVAERMGYPLALKVNSEKVLHKSDVGGVVLNISSRKDVDAALAALEERMRTIGVHLDSVLLQREIPGGIEALVGVTTDPAFGPLLVCGLGGVLVEVLKDVSYRLTPVSDIDAQEMIAKLRSNRLLDGYRGTPPGDRPALIQVIQRVSALAEMIPELRELDLNPVKVLEPGRGVVVVDARMEIGR